MGQCVLSEEQLPQRFGNPSLQISLNITKPPQSSLCDPFFSLQRLIMAYTADHQSGVCGQLGICPSLPENFVRATLPQNCNMLENRPCCCRSDPHCRGVLFYFFPLSGGYKTSRPHFPFSLALLRRNTDLRISLNSLHLCSES